MGEVRRVVVFCGCGRALASRKDMETKRCCVCRMKEAGEQLDNVSRERTPWDTNSPAR